MLEMQSLLCIARSLDLIHFCINVRYRMKSVIPGLLPVAAEWLSDLCWLVTQFVFSCSTILVPAFPSKKKKNRP